MEPNLDQELRKAHALLDLLAAKKLNAVRGLIEAVVEIDRLVGSRSRLVVFELPLPKAAKLICDVLPGLAIALRTVVLQKAPQAIVVVL